MKPLFPGTTCFPLSAPKKDVNKHSKIAQEFQAQTHQLEKIFDIIGTPKKEDIDELEPGYLKTFLQELKQEDPVSFELMLPCAPPEAIELLNRMLTFSRFLSLIHSFIHSFTHSLIHSFIHSFTHSLIHSFIHSFTHYLTLLKLTHSFFHLHLINVDPNKRISIREALESPYFNDVRNKECEKLSEQKMIFPFETEIVEGDGNEKKKLREYIYNEALSFAYLIQTLLYL